MSKTLDIGETRITRAELRAGILNAETWPKVFYENNKTWLKLGGCPLGVGMTKWCNPKAAFNFFPTSQDAVLEWSEEGAADGSHVASSKAEGAVIDVAKLPFLNHKQTFLRPTLLAFEVTGHVMLGIVYQSGRGPEIHILNPWSMTESQQLKDVYELINAKLGSTARKVIVVDVTNELEKRVKPSTINFQAFEKQGFCTLWVGIFARAVIPYLPELNESIKKGGAIGDAVLNERTLRLYYTVYDTIGREWASNLSEAKQLFGEDYCMPTAAAATAVTKLAIKSSRAGKRKPRRQTRRRSLYRKAWTRKRKSLR